jgi:hypothetical protein
MTIASHPVYYKLESEVPFPTPAALIAKTPQGIDLDDTKYTASPNALLRPGIMLSSSMVSSGWRTIASGVLVVNAEGDFFITVASHGFKDDGEVWHPNPQGTLIGKIVETFPHTGISLVKLYPELRYTNITFDSTINSTGIQVGKILKCETPEVRVCDTLTMDNPFTGGCEAQVQALGTFVPEDPDVEYVGHVWHLPENRKAPKDGSCGTPILKSNGDLAGLFRYQLLGSDTCVAVSGIELRKRGYEVCKSEKTF